MILKDVVLITGATSGIGYEFSKIFAKNNYDLLLNGRNNHILLEMKEKLEKDFNINVYTYCCDLKSEDEVLKLYKFSKNNNLNVNILINNAGIGYNGEFSNISWEKHKEVIDLNIKALTYLTLLVIKDMKVENKGKILNVASTGAYQPGPYIAVYYATKAYVLSFTNGLRQEVKDKNIFITTLSPGATKTKFSFRAGKGDLKVSMDPKKVAEKGYKALMKNKANEIPGIMNKVLVFLSKISPTVINGKVVKKIQQTAINKKKK